MKKLLVLLALILAATFFSAAMASSASYQDGYVTVSTEREGFYEIHIDGRSTNRWVGHLKPTNTFKFELTEGTHKVVLFSPDTGAAVNIYITVGGSGDPVNPTPTEKPQDDKKDSGDATPETVEPEQTPYPDSPFTFLYVQYDGGTIEYAFYGLKGYAEISIDGENTGRIVKKNGDHSLNWQLEDGDHKIDLYAVKTDELISFSFTAENVVLDNARYGITVNDAEGNSQPFELGYEKNTMIILLGDEQCKKIAFPTASMPLMSEDGLEVIRIVLGESSYDLRLNELETAIGAAHESLNQVLIEMPEEEGGGLTVYITNEAQSNLIELTLSQEN